MAGNKKSGRKKQEGRIIVTKLNEPSPEAVRALHLKFLEFYHKYEESQKPEKP